MKWPSTIHHVALSVTDRDRSADWYRKVLGFEELFREESAERRACVMRFAGGHYSVGLVEHSGHRDDFDARRVTARPPPMRRRPGPAPRSSFRTAISPCAPRTRW